jgi:mannose-6-phosphate isomerase-like protein (cupin superfamily)
MKYLLMVLAFLGTAALLSGEGGQPPVTFIGHEKVEAALAKGGTLVKTPEYIVMFSHRTGPGEVEVHDKETDVIHVFEGGAIMITGGKMIGGKVTAPGQWRGKEIEGGEEHHLAKNDMMVIPAGVPHWFKAIPESISYSVVKVIKP